MRLRGLLFAVVAAVTAVCQGQTSLSLTGLTAIDAVPAAVASAGGNEAKFVIPPLADAQFSFSRYDLPVDRDLRDEEGLAFDLHVSDPSLFGSMTVLFAMPAWKGYYTVPFRIVGKKDGWSHVEVRKEDYIGQAGLTDGWGRIHKLRFFLSEHPNVCEPVECAIRSLRTIPAEGADAEAWIVQGDVTFREMKLDAGYFSTLARRHRDALREAGLRTKTVFESDFPAEIPPQVKLVVLPYDKHLPTTARQTIMRFAERGGKLLMARLQDGAFVRDLTARKAVRMVGFDWARYAVPQIAVEYERLMSEWFPALASELAERRVRRAAALSPRAAALAGRKGKSGERRFLDVHDAYGPDGSPWEESVAFAATNGITDLIVNFSWGATAFYRSDVLEVSPTVATRGDALASCLAACRKWGVRLHAWRCCWTVGNACSKELRDRLKAEGRFQVDVDGNVVKDWLCPNHPANHRMHVASMVELSKKGVDGIDYDFIRYNGSPARTCFCANCRAAFEKELGYAVTNWPEQVIADRALYAKWGECRARSIGRGIRDIAMRVRREAPGVEISTSGGGDGTNWRISLGRDWLAWARAGWVDFVFLMDYARDVESFTRLVGRQSRVDAGKAFLVPGLGPSCWPYQTTVEDAETIADEVEAVRKAGFSSWGIFQYDNRTFGYLPLLRKGTLK